MGLDSSSPNFATPWRTSSDQIKNLVPPAARGYADLPGGHSEGYDDTFKQVFRRFYASLNASGASEYPQFVDGLRQMQILDSVLKSHRTRQWTDVPKFEE